MKKSKVGKNKKIEKQTVPTDLKKSLDQNSKANEKWKDLTPLARRDFVGWVISAKQTETRNRRIERTCEMLVEGKRRPCCYSIVPVELYKQFLKNPKLKAKWQALNSDEKRDFTDWINFPQSESVRKDREGKVGEMLLNGDKP